MALPDRHDVGPRTVGDARRGARPLRCVLSSGGPAESPAEPAADSVFRRPRHRSRLRDRRRATGAAGDPSKAVGSIVKSIHNSLPGGRSWRLNCARGRRYAADLSPAIGSIIAAHSSWPDRFRMLAFFLPALRRRRDNRRVSAGPPVGVRPSNLDVPCRDRCRSVVRRQHTRRARSARQPVPVAPDPVCMGAAACGGSSVRSSRGCESAAGFARVLVPSSRHLYRRGHGGGTLGGAISHEFMHAPHRVERIVGAGLMSLLTYGHFTIGHVAGHHRWVGTPEDPATARRGETLYAFLIRSFGGVTLAWRAERARSAPASGCVVDGESLSADPRLAGSVIRVDLFVTSWVGVLFFALQGFFGASLLEVMNSSCTTVFSAIVCRRDDSRPCDPTVPGIRAVATTYLMCGIGLHSYLIAGRRSLSRA